MNFIRNLTPRANGSWDVCFATGLLLLTLVIAGCDMGTYEQRLNESGATPATEQP